MYMQWQPSGNAVIWLHDSMNGNRAGGPCHTPKLLISGICVQA